ncbi:polycystin-1-like protein 2 [Mobula birostris]|uniref:polycystin-1-like protein 2 n=1 Tax=Mobula birostris TaxID=1983395 RepID=UPI003B28B83F
MFKAHLSSETKAALKAENTDIAVIPGGLTSALQPLDVCLNKPFKEFMRRQWNEWMMSGYQSFTPAGNIRAAFVLQSWEEMKAECIVKAFKKCSISNALDGTEDHLLWEEDDGDLAASKAANDVEAEIDNPHDDMGTAEEWDVIFRESDNEEYVLSGRCWLEVFESRSWNPFSHASVHEKVATSDGCSDGCSPYSAADLPVEAISCLDQQLAFQQSCYEITRLSRNFLGAQKWCERGGGHLAFILDEETQQFLHDHLEVEKDWWIGLAPWKQNLTQDEMTSEGTLSWLDGTRVTYANWAPAHQPSPSATCAHILKNSMYHWKSTDNCGQELHFICEYESSRAFACDHFNATLQCESGKVIQINSSFYGRKSLSFCTLESVTPTELQDCSWIDVREKVKGLHLLVDDVYAVLENITISQTWLLHPYSGNLTCTLDTGNGFITKPYDPVQSTSNKTYQYRTAGLFTLNVECTSSEWHVTAQKMVSIQQPINGFGIVKCYNFNQSEETNDCTVPYGDPLLIQLVVEEGAVYFSRAVE